MRSLLFVLTIFSVTVSLNEGKILEDIPERKECKKEAGLDEDAPVDLDNREARCIAACGLKKTGRMGSDGKMDMDKVMDYFKNVDADTEEFPKIIQECGESADQRADECEVAAAWENCFMDNIQPHIKE